MANPRHVMTPEDLDRASMLAARIDKEFGDDIGAAYDVITVLLATHCCRFRENAKGVVAAGMHKHIRQVLSGAVTVVSD